MVSFELDFPEDFKIDKPSIDKLIADFQELSLKLREGIMSMVALITSKLVGKLENEITELKKNQKPVNNTKKKSKKKLKKKF
jgi:hypothetical protein